MHETANEMQSQCTYHILIVCVSNSLEQFSAYQFFLEKVKTLPFVSRLEKKRRQEHCTTGELLESCAQMNFWYLSEPSRVFLVVILCVT